MSTVTAPPAQLPATEHRKDPLWRAVSLLHVKPLAVLGAIGAGSLALGSAVALAAVSAWLIVRASQMPLVLDLSVAVVAVRAFGISRGVFRYVERLASHTVALDGMVRLREEVYLRLSRGSTAAVAALRRGDLLARVGADVDSVGDLVVRGLIPAGVALVVSGGTVIAMTAFLPAAGISLALALLISGVAAPALSVRSARIAEQRAARARAEISATSLTVLEGADELAVSGRLESTMRDLKGTENELFGATDAAARPAALAAALNTAALGLAVLAAFWFGIPATESGALAAVELGVIVLTPLASFEAVSVLPAAAVQVYKSRAAAARIMNLLDSAGVEREVAAAAPSEPTDDAASQLNGPARGTERVHPTDCLRATDLACGWPGHSPVIDGVELAVQPGQTVVVVGASGAGKSTLLATLAGLVPPMGGSVQIDGRDLAGIPREQVAELIAYTAEDAHIFATSVLENLRVARGDLTEAQASAAIVDAGLDTWVGQLPQGLDTQLGPDGTTVSGGERRRLLLARALVSPAKYLLLDEPAEHLDAAGERRMLSEIGKLASDRGRGLIVVTHRISPVVDASAILTVADGRTRAYRSADELFAAEEQYRWAWQREQQ